MVSPVPQEKRIKDVLGVEWGMCYLITSKSCCLAGLTIDHWLGPEPKVSSYEQVVSAQPISTAVHDSLPGSAQAEPMGTPVRTQLSVSTEAGWREACISSPGPQLEKTGRYPAGQ